MAPKSKKSRSKRSGSNASLKKKPVSPTESKENVQPIVAQTNTTESIDNLTKEMSKTTADAIGSLDGSLESLENENENAPSSYEITTTYKTEVVECSVDPDTGDIIEVVTEVYLTDAINLQKKKEKEIKMQKLEQAKEVVDSMDLEEVLKQLNMATEICKEVLE